MSPYLPLCSLPPLLDVLQTVNQLEPGFRKKALLLRLESSQKDTAEERRDGELESRVSQFFPSLRHRALSGSTTSFKLWYRAQAQFRVDSAFLSVPDRIPLPSSLSSELSLTSPSRSPFSFPATEPLRTPDPAQFFLNHADWNFNSQSPSRSPSSLHFVPTGADWTRLVSPLSAARTTTLREEEEILA